MTAPEVEPTTSPREGTDQRDAETNLSRESITAPTETAPTQPERLRDTIDKALAELAQALEQGTSESLFPEPETVHGDPGPLLERLIRHIQDRGIAFTRANLSRGVRGRSNLAGKIELAHGLTPAAEFFVLAHELAHEILHRDPVGERFISFTVGETEAEAVAFVVASASGLAVGNSASDYIRLWKGNRETLTASLIHIRRAALDILSAIEPEAIPELPPRK